MDEKILELIKAGKTDEEIVKIMAEERRKSHPQITKKEKGIYKVSMTETNTELYEIEANSEDEAVEICEEKWGEGTLGKPISSDTTDRFFQSED